MRHLVVFGSILGVLSGSSTALAVGESDADGFPNWEERVHLELTNRARVDPQFEMTQCGANCAEAACYSVQPPLYYRPELGRAARFHAAHLTLNGYFAHASNCILVNNIEQLYPNSCDGAASCSCTGGVATGTCPPNPTNECTSASGRVSAFAGGYSGEIIAGGSSPNQAFYLWLYEDAGGDSSCQFTLANGHRWLLLTSTSNVGFGVDGRHVGDFGGGQAEVHDIASGSHWPRQAATVEAWANWNAAAGPSSALVNLDGECVPMQLERGVATNGAYRADLTGVGSGCHRYFFLFRDDNDQLVTYPETGSLGIGPAGTCPDWSTERPTTGASCNCVPQCDGLVCGDDQCGGSCGNCAEGSSCDAGQCVDDMGGGGAGPSATTTTTGTGGATSVGSGTGASGTTGSGGATSGPTGPGLNETGSDDGLHGSCGCRIGDRSQDRSWLALLGAAALVLRRRRTSRG